MLYPVELQALFSAQTLLANTKNNKWSGQTDSNRRPSVPKTDALPGCAMPRTLLGRHLNSLNPKPQFTSVK
jgi:hypothetical protein